MAIASITATATATSPSPSPSTQDAGLQISLRDGRLPVLILSKSEKVRAAAVAAASGALVLGSLAFSRRKGLQGAVAPEAKNLDVVVEVSAAVKVNGEDAATRESKAARLEEETRQVREIDVQREKAALTGDSDSVRMDAAPPKEVGAEEAARREAGQSDATSEDGKDVSAEDSRAEKHQRGGNGGDGKASDSS
jgi:hypothetical protein